MAASLLLMSTTSSPNNQEVPVKPPPLAVLPPHPTTTRGHRHDGRRSTAGVGGRPGKRASSKAPVPKKPAQRGPGVAQLEFLRHQEQLKKMTEMPHHLGGGDWSSPHTELLGVVAPLPLGGTPVQYCVAPPTPVVFPGQMVGTGRGIAGQGSCGLIPYGSDRVVGGFYMPGIRGSAAVALEPPSELSSMPNLRCIPEHCDICMKQKNEMINNARNIVVFDHGAADHAINNRQRPAVNAVPDFLELNLGNGFSSGRNLGSSEGSYGLQGSRQLTYQDVQVINRSVGGGGEESRRLMEYEFFPGKSNSGSSTFPKSLCFPSMEHQAAAMSASANSSASAFAVMKKNISVGAEASCSNPNSIDLSLRLSY